MNDFPRPFFEIYTTFKAENSIYQKNQEFKLWKQVQAIDMGSALVAQWICTCEGDKGALLTI